MTNKITLYDDTNPSEDGTKDLGSPTEQYNKLHVSEDVYIDNVGLNDTASGASGCSLIGIPAIGSPTNDNLCDYLSSHNSSGYSSGGDITDAGSGAINVSAGTGWIRASNSGTAELLSFDWSASNGITLTDNLTNYIYIDYNGGSPVVGFETTKANNGRTKFYIGKVFREGTDLHILKSGQNTTEPMKRIQSRLNSVFGEIQRSSGMILSDEGSLQIAVSAGVYFGGLTRVLTDAFTSTTTDFEYYYLLNGTWTEVDADTIDNLQYNDVSVEGSEELANISNNNYGIHWVYMDIDGHCLVVYGQGNYRKLSDAIAASPPSVSYGHIADMSILVGRVILEKSATGFDVVESAFAQTFTPSVVTEHSDLAGLTDDDHTQYALANGTRGVTEVTGTTQSASVNNTYIANNASQVTVTLPSTAAVGTFVKVAGKGAGGWKVAQNASQTIHFLGVDTTTGTGGYVESTQQYNTIELLCITANSDWLVTNAVGNLDMT